MIFRFETKGFIRKELFASAMNYVSMHLLEVHRIASHDNYYSNYPVDTNIILSNKRFGNNSPMRQYKKRVFIEEICQWDECWINPFSKMNNF